MNLKEYSAALIKLQNCLYSPIRLNDAVLDIIEIGFTDTGDAVYCPPHTHTWFEFNYVTSGMFYTSFGEEMQEIGEGHFFLIPPGMEHSHKYNRKSPHKDIFFRWQIVKANGGEGQYENSFFKQLEQLCFWNCGCCMDDGSLGHLLELMLKHAGEVVSPIKLQLDFINILLALSGSNYLRDAADTAQKDSTAQRYDRDMAGKTIIKKVEVYLNDLKLDNLDVHTLAASLHMSYGHLARVYKKYSGQTILERLSSIRLEKSCMLLVQTDYSMKEISEKLGFSNQYYFSKVFKEKHGMSPSEYRKSSSR